MSLRGDLLSLPLWEVLQLLSSGKKTGKFQIVDEDQIAEIIFKDGKIIYAKVGILENLEALLDLALWNKGNFTFIPDEKVPISNLNLDLFEVLISAEKYVDLVDYLGDFILIPAIVEELSSEEETIVLSFDGIKRVKDVISETTLGKVRTLELIMKLMKERKILRIKEDSNLFWFYIFWRGWNYILKEFPSIGVSERYIRREWRNFLDKSKLKVKSVFEELTSPEEVSRLYFYRYMKEEYTLDEEEIKTVFENMTSGEKILWHNVYKNLKQHTSEEIEAFSKEALRFLFSLSKTSVEKVLDVARISEVLSFVEANLDKIFLYVGKYENFEEEVFSWFFDGERSLKEMIKDSIFDETRTQFILGKLWKDKKIISFEEERKLALAFIFWRFLREISKRYREQKLEPKLDSTWQEFFENNIQDIKYLFEKLMGDLSPNWLYIYRNLSRYTEEEVRGFIKNSVDVLYNIGKENLNHQVLENIWRETVNSLRKFPLFESLQTLYIKEKNIL